MLSIAPLHFIKVVRLLLFSSQNNAPINESKDVSFFRSHNSFVAELRSPLDRGRCGVGGKLRIIRDTDLTKKQNDHQRAAIWGRKEKNLNESLT